MLEALFVYVGVGALGLVYAIGFLWASNEDRNPTAKLNFDETVEMVLFFLIFWPVCAVIARLTLPQNGES